MKGKEMEEKKLLTLEDVLAGIGPIVEADPTFIYPQQGTTATKNESLC